MNNYEQAKEYRQMGWNVVPLYPNKKIPAIKWKKYQEERNTSEELKQWFKDTRNNIAIVTGKISGITVVDCDDQEAIDWFYFNTDGTGRSVDTSQGMHFYHEYAPGRNIQRKGLDVRNDGGLVLKQALLEPNFRVSS